MLQTHWAPGSSQLTPARRHHRCETFPCVSLDEALSRPPKSLCSDLWTCPVDGLSGSLTYLDRGAGTSHGPHDLGQAARGQLVSAVTEPRPNCPPSSGVRVSPAGSRFNLHCVFIDASLISTLMPGVGIVFLLVFNSAGKT